METSNINFLGIVAFVGAVFMIAGVFLTWLSQDLGILGTSTWRGMDVFNSDLDFSYQFVPMVSLVGGILAILLMIVPTFMNTEKFETLNNILGIITLILSAVVVICGILFYTQSWSTPMGSVSLTDLYSIGSGFWIVIVGAIITLVGGLMPIIKNKFMQ